jgi:hypothetical protein
MTRLSTDYASGWVREFSYPVTFGNRAKVAVGDDLLSHNETNLSQRHVAKGDTRDYAQRLARSRMGDLQEV